MSVLAETGSRAVAWNITGRFATHAVTFLTGVVLARLLSPADFGLLALVMVSVEIIVACAEAGMASALMQRRRLHPVHLDSVFYFSTTVSLLLALGCWAVAPGLAAFYGLPALRPLLQAASGVIVLNAVAIVPSLVLRKRLAFRRIALVRLAAACAGGAVGIGLAVRGGGVWSLVWQQLAMAGVAAVLFLLAGGWRPSPRYSQRALAQLLPYGTRMFAARLLDVAFARLDVFLLGKLVAPGLLGQFQRAKSITTLAMGYSFQSIVEVLLPVLSRTNYSPARSTRITLAALDIVSLLAFGLSGLLFACAGEIVVLVYGPQWSMAGSFLRWFAAASFVYPLSALLMTALAASGDARAYLRLELAKKVLLALHLGVACAFGLQAFLATLLLRSVLALAINVRASSRAMEVAAWRIWRPVLAQGGVAVFAASLAVSVPGAPSRAMDCVVRAAVFATAYLGGSALLRGSAWTTTLRLVRERWATRRAPPAAAP